MNVKVKPLNQEEPFTTRVAIDLKKTKADFDFGTETLTLDLPIVQLDWPAEQLNDKLVGQGFTDVEIDSATDAYFGMLNKYMLARFFQNRMKR